MISTSVLVLPLALAGFAVASYTPECEPRTLCVDGINECGTRWGGCYNTCETAKKPTMPPCETSEIPVVTAAPEPQPEDGCKDGGSVFLCIDYINECGMMYGGCHDICVLPTPIYTPPPCPTSGTMKTITRSEPPVTDTPTGLPDICADGEPHSICADGIDACGNGFGTCYDFCATPTMPSMEAPDCTHTPSPTAPPAYSDDGYGY